ncbi:MAG: DUF1801 domain-containing protein [Bacteroidia bacterium]
MAKSKLSDKEEVDLYVQALDPSTKHAVSYLRKMILNINSLIAEHMKWNSPSFYYTGEMEDFDPKTYKRDILVCNLHRGKILLVFPTGTKIDDTIGGKNYADGRKIIEIRDLADLMVKEQSIKEIIASWIKLI